MDASVAEQFTSVFAAAICGPRTVKSWKGVSRNPALVQLAKWKWFAVARARKLIVTLSLSAAC